MRLIFVASLTASGLSRNSFGSSIIPLRSANRVPPLYGTGGSPVAFITKHGRAAHATSIAVAHLLFGSAVLILQRLDDNRRAVGEDFGHAGGDFVGVVPDRQQRVGAEFLAVADHDVVRVL